MYWDIDTYTNNAASPIPISCMFGRYSGKNGSNIAQQSNGWQEQDRNDVALIPEVTCAADKYAIVSTLRAENVALGPSFELDDWTNA